MWQYWLIAAGVFFIGEMMTVGFLIFWFGIAALIAMAVSFITSNIIIQMTVFIISSIILLFSTKPFVKKFANTKTTATNVFSIIGKKALVIEDIDSIHSTGQIKVNGEIWSAKAEDEGIVIPKDSEVEIKNISGVKAIVTPISISTKI